MRIRWNMSANSLLNSKAGSREWIVSETLGAGNCRAALGGYAATDAAPAAGEGENTKAPHLLTAADMGHQDG